MVEHIGESGYWEWFIVRTKTTPIKALRDYCREMDLNPKQKIERGNDGFLYGQDGYYLEDGSARAYEITIY